MCIFSAEGPEGAFPPGALVEMSGVHLLPSGVLMASSEAPPVMRGCSLWPGMRWTMPGMPPV